MIVAAKTSALRAEPILSVSVPVVLNVWFIHVPAHVPASG